MELREKAVRPRGRVILICGRICSGKTTYAKRLQSRGGAVLLSADELMLTLFGQQLGDLHDVYAERTQQYLFAKAAELAEAGIDGILDWGFWQKAGRDAARSYFQERGIACEFHGIVVDDRTWAARIEQRNRAVEAGEVQAYYVDRNLAEKFRARYEEPERNEMDVWVEES